MEYHVILIEYGHATHHWRYNCIECAVQQLNRLLVAYEEVNEVCATIVKAGASDSTQSTEWLIENQLAHPDPDLPY